VPGPLNGPLNGPLDGLKVLEFSEIIAAPYAAMLLADMGADVIKVEPPWGEPWRLFQQFVPLESRTFMAVNRGKRSLPLDLTKPEGQEIVRKRCRTWTWSWSTTGPTCPPAWALITRPFPL